MSVEITRGTGARRIVSRSANLRGIRDYARKSPVRYASVTRKSDGGGFLYLRFADGAECRTDFAEFGVARQWVKNRRSWRLDMTSDSDRYVSFGILCGDPRH